MVDNKNMNHEGHEVTQKELHDIGPGSFVNLSGLGG